MFAIKIIFFLLSFSLSRRKRIAWLNSRATMDFKLKPFGTEQIDISNIPYIALITCDLWQICCGCALIGHIDSTFFSFKLRNKLDPTTLLSINDVGSIWALSHTHVITVRDFISWCTSEANVNTQADVVPTVQDQNDATEKWWGRWGRQQRGRATMYLHGRQREGERARERERFFLGKKKCA